MALTVIYTGLNSIRGIAIRCPDVMFIEALQRNPFFAGLSTTLLHELAAATRMQCCEKGELIILKGDRLTGLYAVLSGVVKLACQSS